MAGLFSLSIMTITACSSLPEQPARAPSMALDGKGTQVDRLFSPAARANPGLSGVHLVDTGRGALRLRLAALAMADRSLDMQYFIWNSDQTGRLVAGHVLQAADRGVRVRLLLDDFNVGERDTPLAAMDAHPNIEVRIYNPNPNRSGVAKWFSLLGDFERLNQRMHNKSFTIDDTLAIVGGRNIGDEYFDAGEHLNFRDRELMVVGPVVPAISREFDAYWNSDRSFSIASLVSDPPDEEEVRQQRARLDNLNAAAEPNLQRQGYVDDTLDKSYIDQLRSELIWADARLIADEAPELADTESDKPKALARTIAKTAMQSQQEVLIESAYFVLGDPGLALFRGLNDRGVRVRALTNSLASNDVIPNHAGYARRRPLMLDSGIELFELRPDAASCKALIGSVERCTDGSVFGLHSKSVVFDRDTVFVGSFNLNMRSVFLNSELGLLVKSPELGQRIASDIEENMTPENSWQVTRSEDGGLVWTGVSNGENVSYRSEPETGSWRRFVSGFIALFPIEKYL